MSFLFTRVARTPLRTTLTTRLSKPALSSFSTCSTRAALNESDRAHGQDRDDVAQHNEEKKQEQLKEQKEGKGQWKKELGSNSEQAIKADRGEVEASDETIAQMQSETAKSAEADKKK